MSLTSFDKSGRVVILKDLREKLELNTGQRVIVEYSGKAIILKPST